jgi:alanyl-tRNA synthetase
MITSADIRARFLRFFGQRGHTIVKSSSLLPGNDPTLLFTNAGMVQFKDVFTGQETRPYTRAASAQKILRVSGKHNDLEEVGPSPRHHTFFEMLGNFSFGDYFKREAISYAWEFLTQDLALDPARLYPTVYVDDDEAYALWQEIAKIPAERITPLGAEDNFWAMGDTGPCGPDSEIFYDRGPAYCTCGNPDCGPGDTCDRWPEIWNLVFMQFEALPDGSMVPLPRPSVDTGMGLERVTSVIQDVASNYDTDLFLPIMRRAREVAGATEEEMRANEVPYRVIADHSRAVAFLIADGVLPGNEGRNYVLRMILRRAARFGKLLGIERPFLAETVDAVVDVMGHHYTELVERQEFIRQVVTQEEERFLATLSVGLARMEELAARLRAEGQKIVPGDEVFRLYDTYGFPFELTRDAAEEAGLTVDEAGFRQAMAAQRERARSAQRFGATSAAETYRRLDLPSTRFLGYETYEADSRVVALLRGTEPVEEATAGEEVEVVLEATPFYGEAGGQVGDTGAILGDGLRIDVADAYHPTVDLIAHRGRVVEGTVRTGGRVRAAVDVERRLDIARNHTATHLLHRALRQILGEHAAQSGSLVAPDRLRFDFGHLAPLSQEEIRRVEEIVNAEIRANAPVTVRETTYEEALREGVVALFGERYGDRVRVVGVEGFSAELCGGTHLHATGEIGLFLVTSETSIGSGLRRIEAVTGRGALDLVHRRLDDLTRVAEHLGARPGEEVERAALAAQTLREQRHTIENLQARLAASSVDTLLSAATAVDGVQVLAAQVQAADVDALRDLGDRLRDRLGSGVVALGAVIAEKPILVVTVSQDLVTRGLHAGRLAGDAARKMGGGGGGRPHMAQAGGKDASLLGEALASVAPLVSERLS